MILSKALLRGDAVAARAGLAVAGAGLVALGAQVDVPMVPVPMSLQTLAVSVVGLTLGARWGAVALLVYVAAGAAGLPVFAGGESGLARLAGPTAGFLWGFVAMAYATGWMAEHGFGRGFGRLFIAALLPAAALFVPGVAGLMLATGMELGRALGVGVIPFLAGFVVKAALAALIVTGGWSLSRR